jgi:deazaflavin-dependent oxidoreductase (nitroreductase family)
MNTTIEQRYVEPGWFTRQVFNRGVRRLTRMGVRFWGSRELTVVGRKSGIRRTTVVNLLDFEGQRYLVAPRGTTEWVRNVRVAETAELRVGRKVERVGLVELADGEKPAILRSYLARWKWEIDQFFQGVGPDAPVEDLAAIAAGYPVFRVG